MTTKEKILTFIAAIEFVLCFLLAVLIGNEVKKPIEITISAQERDVEFRDEALRYLRGQSEFYEYELWSLKEYDANHIEYK